MANICVLPSFEHLRKVCQPFFFKKIVTQSWKGGRRSDFYVTGHKVTLFSAVFHFRSLGRIWIESGLDFLEDPARSGGVGPKFPSSHPLPKKRGFLFLFFKELDVISGGL